MEEMMMIENALVGINMFKDTSIPSTLTIGVLDQTLFRNTSETLADVPWFTVNATNAAFAWNHPIANFYYGGISFDDGQPNMGIFDSFWPGIHLPTTEWGYLRNNWTSNPNMTYLQCNSTTMTCGYVG